MGLSRPTSRSYVFKCCDRWKIFLEEVFGSHHLFQKELEEEVSDLNDDLLATFGIYFEWVREHVSFFYLQLNLSKLDFLKVICVGHLVDDEVASLEPKGSSPSWGAQDDSVTMEKDELKAFPAGGCHHKGGNSRGRLTIWVFCGVPWPFVVIILFRFPCGNFCKC